MISKRKEVSVQYAGRGLFEVIEDTGRMMVLRPGETLTVNCPFSIEGVGQVGDLNTVVTFLGVKKRKTVRKRRK